MKTLIRVILLFAVILVPVSGCKNEEKKDGFNGFSRMVKEREVHRQKAADRKDDRGAVKKDRQRSASDGGARSTASLDKRRADSSAVKGRGGDGKTSTVQRVVILSEEGRRMLGRGIVYLDENGKIIGIRVQ